MNVKWTLIVTHLIQFCHICVLVCLSNKHPRIILPHTHITTIIFFLALKISSGLIEYHEKLGLFRDVKNSTRWRQIVMYLPSHWWALRYWRWRSRARTFHWRGRHWRTVTGRAISSISPISSWKTRGSRRAWWSGTSRRTKQNLKYHFVIFNISQDLCL